MSSFIDKLTKRLNSINSHICVGLDSDYNSIPDFMKKNRDISDSLFEFNKNIILNTHDMAVGYKINLAFYEAYKIEGIKALQSTTKYLKENYSNIPLFADIKRSEIGLSSLKLKEQIFDWLGFDCIMLTPWFGFDSISQFFSDEKYGILIYVHDSNPSASEFQDLKLENGRRLYEEITIRVMQTWNKYGNIIVEAGVTYPKQLKRVREIVGEDMPIFTAGIGQQGGRVANLRGVFGRNNKRLIVNFSRDIIYNFKEDKDNYFKEVKRNVNKLREDILREALLKG